MSVIPKQLTQCFCKTLLIKAQSLYFTHILSDLKLTVAVAKITHTQKSLIVQKLMALTVSILPLKYYL